MPPSFRFSSRVRLSSVCSKARIASLFLASLAFLCGSSSESWAPSKIVIVVSSSNGSLRLSMSKFSQAMMARWNLSIQLIDWVGGSTVSFGQKAGVSPQIRSSR